MTIKLITLLAYRFNQRYFKNGILFVVCICSFGCATNDVELSSPLKEAEKTYPLIYEIKEDRGKIDWLSNFIPDHDNVVIEADKQLKIINLSTKKLVKTIPLKSMEVDFVQLSKTNNRLLIAKSDTNIKLDPKVEIWDTRSWSLLNSFGGIISVGNPGGLSPDGSVLYLNGVIWSVNSGEKLMDLGDESRKVDSSFSRNNRYLAVSSLFGRIRLIDINAKKEIPHKTNINDVIEVRFRNDNHFYASYDYDFRESFQYGGNYPSALGLFNPVNNKLIGRFNSQYRISCWAVTRDGNVFVARVNGDVMLLSPDLEPLKRWSIKQKARYCSADNKNQIWLGVDYSGIYKIDLTKQTIEHPIRLSQNILKFILSPDGKYLGFESEIDKIFRVQVYQVD